MSLSNTYEIVYAIIYEIGIIMYGLSGYNSYELIWFWSKYYVSFSLDPQHQLNYTPPDSSSKLSSGS